MGFWQIGYLEAHAPMEEFVVGALPAPRSYSCGTCGIIFSTERDLAVHSFAGHTVRRPILVYSGRECGRSRLTVTSATSPGDWAVSDADLVEVNGRSATVEGLPGILSAFRTGVVDVTLRNSQLVQEFQFEFAVSETDDLAGVDAALNRLMLSAELSLRTIDDFIMRSKNYPTAGQYLGGLTHYLYGVLACEERAESSEVRETTAYEGKYDQAVEILKSFDRPPAEAICGIVAFHYNQFDLAMYRTRSQRVAEVSLRFQAMLEGVPWKQHSLLLSKRTSLDFLLSDSFTGDVLEWCAMPLDGTAVATCAEFVQGLDAERTHDALKLRLLAAEHSLAAGDVPAAGLHAEHLRDSRTTEHWLADFRRRLQKATDQ